MNAELPADFCLRPAAPEDAPAVTDLICLSDTFDYGEPDYTVEDLRGDWRRPGFVLERDAWLIFAPDGVLCADGYVWDTGQVVMVEPSTCIHPNYRDRGLEESLLRRAEEWTCAHASVKVLQWIVNARHEAAVRRLVERGYRPARHDFVMEISMTSPPPAPVVQGGVVLRPFERGRDERAAWACIQAAFRDARGHVADTPYEDWAPRFYEHGDWSPDLSYLAIAGDEVVGASMGFVFPTGGWIRQFGVRREWRRLGLGLALLHAIFGACYARGLPRVGLGVDAESPTGATRLYERAGMRVKEHFARYEKSFA